jgi:protoporphyrinogen oxidase
LWKTGKNIVDTQVLILGAGPGGLTAAYTLLQKGFQVLVVEREHVAGGLMRPIKYCDFTLDFGHKHIYSRIPDVQKFYETLLGDDLRIYKPRTGILYKGRIFEKEKMFKGIRRGMPSGLLLLCFLDFLKCQVEYLSKPVNSLEDFTYSKRGRKFTRIFSQGFDERFKGHKWADLPLPGIYTGHFQQEKSSNFLVQFVKEAKRSEIEEQKWYHPAKGSGQIIDILEDRIVQMGGKIDLEHEIIRINHEGFVIKSIDIKVQEKQINIKPEFVISSLPLEIMGKIMSIDFCPSTKELSFRRGIVMVYIFLNKKARFPHTSLEVSCPRLKMGRITNYGAYEGSMVPKGKGCLCIEYFLPGENSLLSASDQSIFELAMSECTSARLLSRNDCTGYLIMKCPHADPAVSWKDYVTDKSRRNLFNIIEKFTNLFQINRTGTDKSAYAALMASKAIVEKDKSEFVKRTKPDALTMGNAE